MGRLWLIQVHHLRWEATATKTRFSSQAWSTINFPLCHNGRLLSSQHLFIWRLKIRMETKTPRSKNTSEFADAPTYRLCKVKMCLGIYNIAKSKLALGIVFFVLAGTFSSWPISPQPAAIVFGVRMVFKTTSCIISRSFKRDFEGG